MEKNKKIKPGDLVTVINAHVMHKKWYGIVMDIGLVCEIVKQNKHNNIIWKEIHVPLNPNRDKRKMVSVFAKSIINEKDNKLRFYCFVEDNLEKIK